eukprot:1727593-Pleurochrysis_carterae.AAC.2
MSTHWDASCVALTNKLAESLKTTRKTGRIALAKAIYPVGRVTTMQLPVGNCTSLVRPIGSRMTFAFVTPSN